jgi:hypothetical protein
MDSGVANEQWRMVPSIPGLYISSYGRVKTQRKGGKLSSPYRPNQDKNSGYRYVCKKRLGNLMLSVFQRPPLPGETADHIGKYDGDWWKERGDDRLSNLRWASKSGQIKNQCKPKSKRNSMPVWLRRPEWPSSKPSLFFHSGTEAAKQLNLSSGAVSDCAARKIGKTHHRGWHITRLPPSEPQEDMVHGLTKEIWTDVNTKLRVSSFGRAQWKNNLGDGWGPRFTPTATAGEPYAKLNSNTVHSIIYKAFNGEPGHGKTIDHKDQDKSNNRLDNLRAVSISEQNYNRTVASTASQMQSVTIQGKPIDANEDAWQTFASQNDAARILTDLLGCSFHQGSISKVVLGSMKSTNGWQFRLA